jgi:hypothetical protein
VHAPFYQCTARPCCYTHAAVVNSPQQHAPSPWPPWPRWGPVHVCASTNQQVQRISAASCHDQTQSCCNGMMKDSQLVLMPKNCQERGLASTKQQSSQKLISPYDAEMAKKAGGHVPRTATGWGHGSYVLQSLDAAYTKVTAIVPPSLIECLTQQLYRWLCTILLSL